MLLNCRSNGALSLQSEVFFPDLNLTPVQLSACQTQEHPKDVTLHISENSIDNDQDNHSPCAPKSREGDMYFENTPACMQTLENPSSTSSADVVKSRTDM